MNCQELREDIEKLTALKEDFAARFEDGYESGIGKIAIDEAFKTAAELSDELLEKYLQDFAEKNPELSGGWRMSERIEGFVDMDGDIVYVGNIAALPDGSALVGGNYGSLYHATKGPDGKFSLGERIKGFNGARGGIVSVCAIAVLPDGSAFLGGGNGVLYYATKGPDGKFRLGERIGGVKDVYGDVVDVNAIAALP
ncbi:hypothetical protein J6S46_03240, partial [Candidatus Saccharibacteria bacterium]|nr:hypothetical protein [Candidatus Saccharibacteria bacterium]